MKKKATFRRCVNNYLAHTKNNNGITLIALIVTIIILIILAGITLGLVLGENGILNKAKQGKRTYEEAAIIEKVEMALMDYATEKAKRDETPEVDDALQYLLENNTFEEIDIESDIGVIEYYEITLTKENGEVVIGDIVKIEGSLRIRASLSPAGYTNEEVTITIKATGNVRKIIKPNEEEEQAVEGNIETTYTVSSNGTYTFIVEDEEGNQTEKKVIVNKIDKVAPNDFTIKVQNITEVGFTVEGETQDGEATEESASSGIDRYEYFVKKETETSYPEEPYTTNQITGLAQGSYKVYAVAYDKAGNFKNSNEITVKISMKIAKLMSNSSGFTTYFVIDTSGNLWGCGHNDNGQLGDGTHHIDRNTPIPIKTGTKFKEVSSNAYHTLAIDEEGNLWACGGNQYGKLGNNSTTDSYVLVQIKVGTKFKEVSAGNQHSLAIDEEGNLWAWGGNFYGQLGNNSTTDSYVPVQIKAGTKFKEIAAGFQHSLAIDEEGNLWAWGSNSQGEVGDGTRAQKTTPVPIKAGTQFKEIAAGTLHSLAIDEEGNLWAWGNGGYGQLGNGTTTNIETPIQIKPETKFKKVASGGYTSFAIDEAGNLWAWGYGVNWSLGNGNTSNVYSPLQITTGTEFKEIAAGNAIGMALDKDGNPWGWGGSYHPSSSVPTLGGF